MKPEMNMGIVDPYTHMLDMMAVYVQQSYDNMEASPDNDWTLLFCERMRAHTNLNDAIKGIANKRVRGSLDHAMTETLAMQMRALLSRKRPDLTVHSEKTIPRKGVKPDISVWKGEDCIAVVECKVQLGWSRGAVAKDFLAREAKLTGAGVPANNIWHVVASQCNWERDGNAKWGDRWRVVGLEYTGHWRPATVIHPLEAMYELLVRL
jgi:hypothetical protein